MPVIGESKFNAGVSLDSTKHGDSADFSSVAGTCYVISMGSGSPTGDLLVTLDTPNVGDSVTFVIDSSHATHGVDFDGLIATVSYSGTSPFRLVNTGDHVTFRYRGGVVGWLAY